MSDKDYSVEKETAILIDSVIIDGLEIIPNKTHLAYYFNERNIDSPTSYLGFNGTWRLQINEPFYLWQHRIIVQGLLLLSITAYARVCVDNADNTISIVDRISNVDIGISCSLVRL